MCSAVCTSTEYPMEIVYTTRNRIPLKAKEITEKMPFFFLPRYLAASTGEIVLAIRKGFMVLTSTVIQENTAPSANTCTNPAGL